MDNELLLLMAWAGTASLAAIYYSMQATKKTTMLVMFVDVIRQVAEGTVTLERTKEGIQVKRREQ